LEKGSDSKLSTYDKTAVVNFPIPLRPHRGHLHREAANRFRLKPEQPTRIIATPHLGS
jgi:hypothetical protein